MNEIQLSILIPTVIGREEHKSNLLKRISETQHFSTGFAPADLKILGMSNEDVEVLLYTNNKEITIGEKRERLYQTARGIYSWQIDDDDNISDNAIHLILKAIKKEPDCITFQEYVNIDGKEYTSNHSLKYDDWAEKQDGFDYVRTPFFKSVIKTEIARNVPIPHIRFGEDHQWAQALKPHLKTEVHIDEQLYRYIHVSSNHNERYGIK